MLNLQMKIRNVHVISLIWEVSGEPHKVAYIHYMKIKKLIVENKKVKDLRQSNIAAYKRIKGQLPDSNFPIFAYLCRVCSRK